MRLNHMPDKTEHLETKQKLGKLQFLNIMSFVSFLTFDST